MNSSSRGKMRDEVLDSLVASRFGQDYLKVGGVFLDVEIERQGEIIERFSQKNLVVSQGLTLLTGSTLLGVTAITSWRVLLVSGTPTIAAGDTYASHAGWTEVVNYDEATRPAWTGVAGAAGVATNSAARAEFTISTGGATVGGIGIVGGGTDPTVKGNTAGGGTLFSASAFGGGNRVLVATDILRVTWQFTAANA